MKPGDLVNLCFTVIPVNEPDRLFGLIIKEVLHYDRLHLQVHWSNGEILIKDPVDLEIVNETR